jgi:deoxyribodipyrimidine photo-lyase
MISIFWFRRDLRLHDNMALNKALESGNKVLPIFIFDQNILDELPFNDARLSFIYDSLKKINNELNKKGTSLLILKGDPFHEWKNLLGKYEIANMYFNKDYEPYTIDRDQKIEELLNANGVNVFKFKDQLIFEESEILKNDGTPYTVFTPYKNRWLEKLKNTAFEFKSSIKDDEFYPIINPFPAIEDLGFKESIIKVKDFTFKNLDQYSTLRDYPFDDATSYLSPHLRFGTVSIRKILSELKDSDAVFKSELIWREFFMQILFHFPKVIDSNFKSKYDGIDWRNNKAEFELWCQGKTGYPMVDAGIRQLNETGYMHNRVRMVVASFLVKHLLIDWRWGEAYFAEKLVDYELSSNNGNWQWAAGTGCDAAPYFRIFNPSEQLKKFDKDLRYVKQWIPEIGTSEYPNPMVDHKFARERALKAYKQGINQVLN